MVLRKSFYIHWSAGRSPRVHEVNPGRDPSTTPNFNRPGHPLKAMSRPASALPTETPLSRPKTLVATPNHHKAARIMLRHQIGVPKPLKPLQVVTSKLGRDTVSPAQPQSRSQHQNQVVTLLETNLCRDINFMSRPRFCPQCDFPVAKLKIQVATSHTATHVATLK